MNDGVWRGRVESGVGGEMIEKGFEVMLHDVAVLSAVPLPPPDLLPPGEEKLEHE